ncbi:MAG TPA: peptidoglycan-binding domain-containing protein [Gemmatimonadota bacterium]|nr:peptidoglycan-binding domain-containing protein [Gemmatimonadota bacterium]
MMIFRYVGFALTLGGCSVLVAPVATPAQPAVAAASSIRVVEIVDPWTGERIRTVAEDLTAPEIARIQRALASAGFDPGRATGRLDSATLLAVGRFQASRGLFWCDCVTYETILALRIRPFLVASIRAPIEGLWAGSDILVLAPDHGFHHGSAVVVGHSPSVFVGHDPARGAGQVRRHPIHGPRSPARPSRPGRPSRGPTTSGSGAPIRDLTPPRHQKPAGTGTLRASAP